MKSSKYKKIKEARKGSKRNKSVSQYDDKPRRDYTIKLAWTIRLFLWITSVILTIIFSWLKLEGIPFSVITNDIVASYILKISLIIYFFSWILGCNFDIYYQTLVYETVPNKGDIPKLGYFAIFGIVILFGLLCWIDSFKKFSLVLPCFWILDHLSLIYMIKKIVNPALKDSLDYNQKEHNYRNIEKINVISEYLRGIWAKWRFLVGFSILLFIIFLSFTDYPSKLSNYLTWKSADFVISLSILFFVLLVEIWIWLRRIGVRICFRNIDSINEHYRLSPK